MKQNVTVRFDGHTHRLTLEVPNTCPHCGMTMTPNIRSHYVAEYYDKQHGLIGLLVQCTDEKCLNFFVLEYSVIVSNGGILSSSSKSLSNAKLVPLTYLPFTITPFPKEIEDVSPKFVEIYNQSEKAEQANLSQISGIGYRKSLEFLVKDFLIKEHPTDSLDTESELNTEDYINQVKKDKLGKVIAEKLDSVFPPLRPLAKAANWIGTDLTHYETRYTDYDVETMKNYIRAAVTFINGYLLSKEAAEFTNDSN